MGQPHHSATMSRLTGQEAGTAGRAGRCRTECLAEENPFLRQALQMRRRDGIAVRPDISSGIVRVEIEDIGVAHISPTFVYELGLVI